MCRGRLATQIQTKDIKFLGKCCHPFKRFKISIYKQGGLTAETNKYELKESKFPVPKLRTKYCRQSRPHFAHFCLEALKCWVLRGKTKASTPEFPVQLTGELSETLLRNSIHFNGEFSTLKPSIKLSSLDPLTLSNSFSSDYLNFAELKLVLAGCQTGGLLFTENWTNCLQFEFLSEQFASFITFSRCKHRLDCWSE